MSRAVRTTLLTAGALALVMLPPPTAATAQSPLPAAYWLYVANESADVVSVVRFDGRSAVEEQRIEVGAEAGAPGARSVAVSPDGQYWYVALASDAPTGSIWKMRTGTNELVDSVTLGLMPVMMSLTPDGSTLFASDWGPANDARPSVVSAVYTSLMAPIARIETCVHPFGTLVSRDGRNQYSGCLVSDQLVETSTETLAVTRRMSLTLGHEGLSTEGPDVVVADEGACRPSDLATSRDDGKLYVTCSGRSEVLEIDRENFRITRRFRTGDGPYEADISPDGTTLVVTLREDQQVAVIDIATGTQKRVTTGHSFTHGVAVSPDGRYAFVSNEAAPATPGSVDVIDLLKARVVATAELPDQVGDLAFWKMESAAP